MTGLDTHRIARGKELDRHGLFADVGAHHTAESLHEHALRRRRCQVHHDRGAGLVPAFGQQVRVAQHVDVTAGELTKDLVELADRRLPGDGGGIGATCLHLIGQGVCLCNGRRVRNAGQPKRAKVLDPDIGAGLVPERAIERTPKARLVEVPADADDVRQVDGTLDTQAPQRRKNAAFDRLEPVERRGNGTEHLLDVAGCGGRGRGEPGERGFGGTVEEPARLLAECGVRLVADDQAKAVPLDLVRVAQTGLVRRDRDPVTPGGRWPVHVVGHTGEVTHQRGCGLVGQVATRYKYERRHVERCRKRAERDRLARSGRRVDPRPRCAQMQMGRKLIERFELMFAQRHPRPGSHRIGERQPECISSRVSRDGGRFCHAPNENSRAPLQRAVPGGV